MNGSWNQNYRPRKSFALKYALPSITESHNREESKLNAAQVERAERLKASV